jgi:hypothetical protein
VTRSRAAAAAAAAFFSCGLAACGGSPPALPVAQVVTRINAICTSYTGQIEAIVPPAFTPASATAAQLGTAARYLSRAVPLLQSERSSIQAAGTPTTDGTLYDSMLAALATHVQDEQAAQAAAQAGDLRSFRSALRGDQAATTRLSGIAQQFGVTACLTG